MGFWGIIWNQTSKSYRIRELVLASDLLTVGMLGIFKTQSTKLQILKSKPPKYIKYKCKLFFRLAVNLDLINFFYDNSYLFDCISV